MHLEVQCLPSKTCAASCNLTHTMRNIDPNLALPTPAIKGTTSMFKTILYAAALAVVAALAQTEGTPNDGLAFDYTNR